MPPRGCIYQLLILQWMPVKFKMKIQQHITVLALSFWAQPTVIDHRQI
jgi:hypothetical protein